MKFRYAGLSFLSATLLLYSCKKDNTPSAPPQPDLVISSFSEHAAGNDIITITGSGFSDNIADNKVTINGKTSEVMSASKSEIRVKVPIKAGSGLIEVTYGAKKASSAKAFTYDFVWYVSTLGGTRTTPIFEEPMGIAIGKNGALYVSDKDRDDIKKIVENEDGTVTVTSVALSSPLSRPTALWINEAEDFLVNDQNNRMVRYNKSGIFQTWDFGFGEGVAADEAGNIYRTLYQDHTVRKLAPDNSPSTIAGVSGNSTILNYPKGITVNKNGSRVVVADWASHRIRELNRKIDGSYEITTLAGTVDGSEAGAADGKGTDARFRNPVGVAMDESGAVYVTDSYNHKIRKIVKSNTGEVTVTTIAGTGNYGTTNGKGNKATFNYPSYLCVNPAGTLIYVSDQGNDQVRKLELQ